MPWGKEEEPDPMVEAVEEVKRLLEAARMEGMSREELEKTIRDRMEQEFGPGDWKAEVALKSFLQLIERVESGEFE